LFVADIKMDPSMLFEDLTWADIIIIGDANVYNFNKKDEEQKIKQTILQTSILMVNEETSFRLSSTQCIE